MGAVKDWIAKCPECQAQVIVEAEQVQAMRELRLVHLLDSEIVCESCEGKQALAEKRETEKRERERFLAKLPLEYRDADPNRCAEWCRPAVASRHLRLGIIGPAGSGKSSALACHLKQRSEPFIWVTATRLRDIATKSATEGGEWAAKMEKLRRVKVLAIDDLSQPKFTEAFASSFFDLLEHRNANRLAVVWTCQKSLPELRRKIAEQSGSKDPDFDQADAISRRLIQDGLKLESHHIKTT